MKKYAIKELSVLQKFISVIKVGGKLTEMKRVRIINDAVLYTEDQILGITEYLNKLKIQYKVFELKS